MKKGNPEVISSYRRLLEHLSTTEQAPVKIPIPVDEILGEEEYKFNDKSPVNLEA